MNANDGGCAGCPVHEQCDVNKPRLTSMGLVKAARVSVETVITFEITSDFKWEQMRTDMKRAGVKVQLTFSDDIPRKTYVKLIVSQSRLKHLLDWLCGNDFIYEAEKDVVLREAGLSA